jgi:hypothetical protein
VTHNIAQQFVAVGYGLVITGATSHVFLLLRVGKSGVKLYDAPPMAAKLFYAEEICSSAAAAAAAAGSVTRCCATNAQSGACRRHAKEEFDTAKNTFQSIFTKIFTLNLQEAMEDA